MLNMRLIAIVVIFYLSFVGDAFAWFFQPPPSDSVPEAAVQQFSNASSTALEAFSIIFSTFAQAEQNEVALTDVGDLTKARTMLDAAAQQFAAMPAQEAGSVAISRDAIATIDERALNIFDVNSLNSLEDIAGFAGGACEQIATLVGKLIEVQFGPGSSGSREPRLAVNQLSDKISQFIIVLNTASGALAVQKS